MIQNTGKGGQYKYELIAKPATHGFFVF
jgi:hypothetical protein